MVLFDLIIALLKTKILCILFSTPTAIGKFKVVWISSVSRGLALRAQFNSRPRLSPEGRGKTKGSLGIRLPH